MKTYSFFSIIRFALLLSIVLTLEAFSATNSQVTIIGYHRFENPAKDSGSITPENFRRQMQEIKDAGITVISMQDFLAWRRGEKEIPEKCALITIDDGYNCTYQEAWPILKEFGYPFTFFVYSGYINTGGRAITWKQLAELRDAGVEIGGHSASHDNLVRPRRAKNINYEEWLTNEFTSIKSLLEGQLGIKVKTFAYPYGIQNEVVRNKGLEAGYEVLFTVDPKKISKDAPAGGVGRYLVQSDKPQTFRSAIQFGAGQINATTKAVGSTAPGVEVSPAHGATVADTFPFIEANLSSLGAIDPKSIEMRISGIGQVPAAFDVATGKVSYQLQQRLHAHQIHVQVRAKVAGKRVDTAWEFQNDPNAVTMAETMMEPAPSVPAKSVPSA